MNLTIPNLRVLIESDPDTDADDARELRDLARDIERESLTGQKLRDALISDISDMHKEIY